jgi:hypothetical protein
MARQTSLSDCLLLSIIFVTGWGEKRVMEKMKNDTTVFHLSHNPGYGDGWSD